MNKARRASLKAILNNLIELRSSLECIRDEEEMAFDNLPESIQESERGETMQEAVDNLNDACDSMDEAIDSLENIF